MRCQVRFSLPRVALSAARSPHAAMCFVLIVLGAHAHAARAELLTGEEINVAADEVIAGNFYATGNTVVIRGEILGDAMIAAANVTIEGRVHGDVLAAAGQITLLGNIDGDARLIGGELKVLGPVGGDVVLAGGTVELASTTGGDAYIASGGASIVGDVVGALYLAGGDVRLGAHVGSDVVAEAARLALDQSAIVDGDLRYTGDALDLKPGAVVRGAVLELPRAVSPTPVRGARLIGWLRGVVGVSLFGLLWLLPFRSFAGRCMDTLRERPGLSFGIGAAGFFAAPLLLLFALSLGALVGGWWISFFGFAVYSMALSLGVPVVAALVGRELLMKPLRARSEAIPMILALAVFGLITLIPIVGALSAFVVMLFGLGALLVTVRQTFWPRALPTALPPPAVASTAEPFAVPR